MELTLFEGAPRSYHAAFKDLYYHLYSNSRSSRAERIVEDLAKVLMAKIASDRGSATPVSDYASGVGTANQDLLPALALAYPGLISESDVFTLGDDAIRRSLQLLQDVDVAHAPSHVLGEAFQALMGPRLRGDKGQFFTPRSLVRSIVRALAPPASSVVVDPACGTGGFLTETAIFWADSGYGSDRDGRVIGIDKDRDLARLAAAALEMVAPNHHQLMCADSLDIDMLLSDEGLGEGFSADYVLTNPPFGAKIGVANKRLLQRFELARHWVFSSTENRWVKTDRLRSSQDPQLLFIELCVRLLKPGGRLGIVLPEGVFGNKRSGYVWDYLLARGTVIGLIDCPRTTFQPGTDTKTNVLLFEKSAAEPSSSRSEPPFRVPVAVALHCGHDRRGNEVRPDGTPHPDDFAEIGATYGEVGKSGWGTSTVTDPYYWVPRFYDADLDAELESLASELEGEVLTVKELRERGLVRVRKGDEVGSDAYGTGDIPFVRTSDISNLEVSADPTKSVSLDVYEKYRRRQKLAVDDILLVVDGRYRIGKMAVVHDANVRSVVQSHIKIITVDSEAPFDAYELLYLLKHPIMLQQMRALTFVQSTLGSLGKRIERLRIPVPNSSKHLAWREEAGRLRTALKRRADLLATVQEFDNREAEL